MILKVPDVLELAFYLGLLNYFLGNLIKALPIPITSVKRLGLNLVKDSLSIWILASSFTLILNAIDYIRGILDISWTPLWVWFGVQTATIIGYINALKALGSVLGNFLGSVFGPIISSAISILTTALTSIMALEVLSIIVNTRSLEILALGIVLYSIPLRIFRRSGSLLISFIVIFSIALPGLPLFVEFLSTNILESETSALYTGSIAYPEIYVKDLSGGSLSYGLLVFYNDTQNDPIAMYPTNSNGVLVMSNSSWGLPVNRDLAVVFESVGWRFSYDKVLNIPSTCIYTLCKLTIVLPGIIISDSTNIVVHRPQYLVEYYFEKEISSVKGVIKLIINLASEDNLIITHSSLADIFEITVNGEKIDIERSRYWEWYGLSGYDIVIPLRSGGVYEVVISYSRTDPKPLDMPVKGYALEVLGADPLLYFLSTAITTMFLTLIFPTAYLSLLIMATYSLARFLEGR